MSRRALARLAFVFATIAALAGAAILIARPVSVRQAAFPDGPGWLSRPLAPDRPAEVSLVAPLGGLSEIWVRRAGPDPGTPLAGTLRPAGGGPAIAVAGERIALSGRDYFRFAFPPIEGSAGRRYDLSFAARPASPNELVPAVLESPDRYYPAGTPGDRRQVLFEAVYSTAGWRVAADLAGRLSGVEGDRWAPAGLAAALIAIEGTLIVMLLTITRRAGQAA